MGERETKHSIEMLRDEYREGCLIWNVADELLALRTERDRLEREAAFYRHCLVNGFPKQLKMAPSMDQRWAAFANEMTFYGATPEEAMQKAIDAALKSEPQKIESNYNGGA
jgi:hypothetical protein